MELKGKLNNKITGIICEVIGVLFIVAGLAFFILLNAVNLYSQKTVATILSRTEVKSDDPYVYVELAYRVGGELVTSASTYREEIPEDQIEMTIYYNIKNPTQLEDGGWNFEPAAIMLIGTLILMVGVYYVRSPEIKNRSKKNSKWDINYAKVKDRFESDLIMLVAAISLLIFGIVVRILVDGFWPWIVLSLGGIAAIYILIDFIPVCKEYASLKNIKNIKVKAVTTDDDFEKFEKEEKAKKLIEESRKEGLEIEETFEIKNVKGNKKRR